MKNDSSMSAFNWRAWPQQIDWSDLQVGKRLAAASSARQTEAYETGDTRSAIRGISAKADARIEQFAAQAVRRRKTNKKGKR